MENIKPCPFCGGKGEVKAAKKDYIGFTIWCECEKCYAKTSGYCPELKDESVALENIDICRDKAIKAWNRRANDEAD